MFRKTKHRTHNQLYYCKSFWNVRFRHVLLLAYLHRIIVRYICTTYRLRVPTAAHATLLTPCHQVSHLYIVAVVL